MDEGREEGRKEERKVGPDNTIEKRLLFTYLSSNIESLSQVYVYFFFSFFLSPILTFLKGQ
jgi:hypothetical protein